MDGHMQDNIPDRDKACIDVNKDFLVALSNAYSNQSKELLRSTIAYSHQAIQGMFLLHGACATAIVATKEISTYKSMLILLAVGACLSVLTAGFSYLAQRYYSKHYDIMSNKCLHNFHGNIQHLARPDFAYAMVVVESDKATLRTAKNYSDIACILWSLSAMFFLFALTVFIYNV